MDGYWESPEAKERLFRNRWLETARTSAEQEPRRKSSKARCHAEGVAFRQVVRDAITRRPSWPRLRAALALDFTFITVRTQAPGLWNLPKNYLDLLGATSAPADDPGPVLFRDDSQVKMLFASCMHRWEPDGSADPAIYLKARTRASAIADMELAGELLGEFGDELGAELVGGSPWGSYAEVDAIEAADERRYLPPSLVASAEFHDRERLQAYLLDQNDRMLRGVFFGSGRWLLTGADPEMRKLERLGLATGSPVIEELKASHAETNLEYRKLLISAISIELPPLPLRQGDGAAFSEGIRQACRSFVERFPVMTPLVAPLRVTVLAVQPRRHAADVKDLDNILINVLRIMEDELKPHAEPWLLRPSVSDEPNPQRDEGLARLRRIGGSNTWAYQVLQLHRSPIDGDEGSLVLIPGLGWNRDSIWSEAEDIVEKGLEKLTGRCVDDA